MKRRGSSGCRWTGTADASDTKWAAGRAISSVPGRKQSPATAAEGAQRSRWLFILRHRHSQLEYTRSAHSSMDVSSSYRLMATTATNTQKTCSKGILALSIITLVLTIGFIAAKAGLGLSGVGMSQPTCSTNYTRNKFDSLHLQARAHSATALVALLSLVIVLVISIKNYRKVCIESEQPAYHQNVLFEQPIEPADVHSLDTGLFFWSSIATMMLVVDFGGPLGVWIDGGDCSEGVSTGDWLLLTLLGGVDFVGGFLMWVFGMVFMRERPWQKQEVVDEVGFGETGRQMLYQEEEMSRKFEREAKEYISNNINRRPDMMEGLLGHQHQIYATHRNDSLNMSPNRQGKVGHNIFSEEGSEYSPSADHDLDDNPVDLKEVLLTSKRFVNNPHAKISAAAAAEEAELEMKLEQNEAEQARNTCLVVEDEDDLVSENFNHRNFELMEELEPAMDDKEELSPWEVKQVQMFSKKDFKVDRDHGEELLLEKKYTEGLDPYKINIHFTKIKPHKKALKKAMRETEEKEEEKAGEEEEIHRMNSVVTDEDGLFKIIKGNLKRNRLLEKGILREQTECPIGKFVEEDEQLEVAKPSADNLKKIEYAKEELVMAKKRKEGEDLGPNHQMSKNFNEESYLQQEQREVFGEAWVERMVEKQVVGLTEKRKRKRRLVDVIRSKFAD